MSANNPTFEQFSDHSEKHNSSIEVNPAEMEVKLEQAKQEVLANIARLRKEALTTAMPTIIKVLKEMPQLKFIPEPMLKLLVNALISERDKHKNPLQDSVFNGVKAILGPEKMFKIYEQLDDIVRKIEGILSKNRDGLGKLVGKI